MSQNRSPDDLANYLDDLLQSADPLSPDMIDDPLVETALELTQDAPPKLDAAMRARMRERVQQAHKEQIASKRTIQFPAPAQALLRWVAVFAVFVILLNNVAVPAMADSLPGDVLYPVKLTIESVELGLATSDETRAEVYVRQAQRRIVEAKRLLDSDTVNTQLITLAINNLDQASQLVAESSTLRTNILSMTADTAQLIGQVAEHSPESAAELYVQLTAVDPGSETVIVTEEPDATVSSLPTETTTLTATATVTETIIPSPTETMEPTSTHTPTTVPTHTPTNTPVPTHTYTPEPTATQTIPPTPTYESYIGVVSATANVNIRAIPTTDGEIIDQVSPGTIVTVVGESVDGEWLQISINDSTKGWIAHTLITEGTVPEFTIETASSPEATGEPLNSIDTIQQGENNQPANDSSNQGNDGINKFGCDGQGNSCNAGDQSDNSNSGGGSSGNNGNNGKGRGRN